MFGALAKGQQALVIQMRDKTPLDRKFGFIGHRVILMDQRRSMSK